VVEVSRQILAVQHVTVGLAKNLVTIVKQILVLQVLFVDIILKLFGPTLIILVVVLQIVRPTLPLVLAFLFGVLSFVIISLLVIG